MCIRDSLVCQCLPRATAANAEMSTLGRLAVRGAVEEFNHAGLSIRAPGLGHHGTYPVAWNSSLNKDYETVPARDAPSAESEAVYGQIEFLGFKGFIHEFKSAAGKRGLSAYTITAKLLKRREGREARGDRVSCRNAAVSYT